MAATDYIGNVKAPTRVIAEMIEEAFDLPHYGKPYNGPVMWGYNPGGAEHRSGLALDVMISSDVALGNQIASWLWKHRRKFGVKWIIWRQRIRNPKIERGKWRGMEDRGSGTNNHMDHIHVLFDGRSVTKDGDTSPKPPTQVPQPKPEEKFYQPEGVDMSVKQIQKAVKVAQDGDYGEATKAAVAKMQKRLSVPVDGYWGPVTEDAYEDMLEPKPEPGGGRRAPKFQLARGHWYGVESSDPKNHSGYHEKDRGGIRQLQVQLATVRGWRGMGKIDGVFGEKTEAVVKKFQRQKGLKVDGLVGAKTWSAAWTEPRT